LPVRFEKLRVSHLALLQLACAPITFRQVIVLALRGNEWVILPLSDQKTVDRS